MPINRDKEANALKVVPVIDILDGVAVHAVRGRRSEYQPLKSVLCTSAKPLDVALAFKKFGFSELYVADLDAIMTGRSNFSVLKQITENSGLSLMVDAGIADIERAEKLLNNNVSKVIIGTETLPSMSFIREAVETLGKEQIVVSLDLKGEKVIGKLELGQLSNPLDFMQNIQEANVNQIIMLDLARVGSSEGVNMPLLHEVLKKREVKVFVGGGVRGIADLMELRKMGAFGVLIATALHSKKITLAELKQRGFLL